MNTPKRIAWNESTAQPSRRRSKFPILSFTSGTLLIALLAGCKPDASNKPVKGGETVANEITHPLSNPSQSDLPPPQNVTVTNVEPAPLPQNPGTGPGMSPGQSSPVVTALKKTAMPAAGPGKEYVVNKGDTLYKIARANSVTVNALTQANPKLKTSKLKSGQKIQIPAASPASAGFGFAEPGSGPNATTSGSANVHVVKAGENLTQIAKKHGTTVKALQAANQMKVTRVFVGQKLKLPAPAAAPPTTSATGTGAGAPAVTKVSDASPPLKP